WRTPRTRSRTPRTRSRTPRTRRRTPRTRSRMRAAHARSTCAHAASGARAPIIPAGSAPGAPSLGVGEARGSLLEVRLHCFHLVARAEQAELQLGLELERLAHGKRRRALVEPLGRADGVRR